MLLFPWSITLVAAIFAFSSAGRVAELGEKFLEYVKKGDISPWLVMFYAPWCHHCKQLEPIFMEAATDLQKENVGVYVGKVDCTKYTSLATHFSIRGFPTVLFIDKNKVVEFNGDRTIDDIVEFTRRLSGLSVLPLKDCDQLNAFKSKYQVLITYFGPTIWSNFTNVANSLQSSSWFFHSKQECSLYEYPAIYITKPSAHGEEINLKYDNRSDNSLEDWIMANRFPQFVRISYANFNHIINSGKLLAIGLVEASKTTSQAAKDHIEFRNNLETVAHSYGNQELFIFGWTTQNDLINSILIHTVNPLPNFIILNSSNLEYFSLEGDVDSDKINNLINALINDPASVKAHGGNQFHHRFMRMCYDTYSSLAGMYKGNPILTLLVFGLPLSLLSIILYSSCCSDLFDAPEDNDINDETDGSDEPGEDSRDDDHQKKD